MAERLVHPDRHGVGAGHPASPPRSPILHVLLSACSPATVARLNIGHTAKFKFQINNRHFVSISMLQTTHLASAEAASLSCPRSPNAGLGGPLTGSPPQAAFPPSFLPVSLAHHPPPKLQTQRRIPQPRANAKNPSLRHCLSQLHLAASSPPFLFRLGLPELSKGQEVSSAALSRWIN